MGTTMEPASDQWDNLLQDWVTSLDTWLPQWSPPGDGGSVPTHTLTEMTNIVPQWSRL